MPVYILYNWLILLDRIVDFGTKMGNIEIKQQKLPNHHIHLTRITYPIFWAGSWL